MHLLARRQDRRRLARVGGVVPAVLAEGRVADGDALEVDFVRPPQQVARERRDVDAAVALRGQEELVVVELREGLGFGRVVVSETELPNMLAILG